jgi:hypothetical protein
MAAGTDLVPIPTRTFSSRSGDSGIGGKADAALRREPQANRSEATKAGLSHLRLRLDDHDAQHGSGAGIRAAQA